MKKRILIFLTAILMISMLPIPVSSHGAEPYSWYCKHMKDGLIPPIDPQFRFIENYGAYYIDKNATGMNKTVYLTFDAGYENGNVEKILDTLKEKNVHGAFFILEHLAESEPELVKRMEAEGHLVCNHTASHKDMTKVTSKEEFASELKKLEDAVFQNCGVKTAKFYRPPEGRFSEQNLRWADELGYKTVFWSFAYADWDNNAQMSHDAAMKKLTEGMHAGEILLLHPTSSTNAEILGELIDTFREQGFTFKTLDSLSSIEVR